MYGEGKEMKAGDRASVRLGGRDGEEGGGRERSSPREERRTETSIWPDTMYIIKLYYTVLRRML